MGGANKPSWKLVLGVGLSFTSKNLFFGVSSPGLLNKIGLGKNKDWELTSRDFTYLHLSGGFNFSLSDKFTVRPSAIYRSMPKGPDLFNSILEFDYSGRFSLGSLFTNNDTIGAFFKLKTKKGFHIGYGYEFLSGNDRQSLSIQLTSYCFVLIWSCLLYTSPSPRD